LLGRPGCEDAASRLRWVHEIRRVAGQQIPADRIGHCSVELSVEQPHCRPGEPAGLQVGVQGSRVGGSSASSCRGSSGPERASSRRDHRGRSGIPIIGPTCDQERLYLGCPLGNAALGASVNGPKAQTSRADLRAGRPHPGQPPPSPLRRPRRRPARVRQLAPMSAVGMTAENVAVPREQSPSSAK
jgi:hypothetical protein